MSKPIVFISCGQCTIEEKKLGKDISEIVKSYGFQPFFAEEEHDLIGLNENILAALHKCSAFITVLHPRGQIHRPDGSLVVRASVWIEQEIAIAAYIRHLEKPALPVIAFAHESVGLEGIRILLNINPDRFNTGAEVLSILRERLQMLQISDSTIELRMESEPMGSDRGHEINRLNLRLVNNTNQRIEKYNGKLWVPRELLNHSSSDYLAEETSNRNDPKRTFGFNEKYSGPINPHDVVRIFRIEYCRKCALDAHRGITQLAANAEFEAKVWLNDNEYPAKKTVAQLGQEAFDRTRSA